MFTQTTDPYSTATVAMNNATTTQVPPVRRYLDPYGNLRGNTTTSTDWPTDRGLLDKPVDDAGLVLFGARYYDAGLGAFISVAPVMDLADPDQWNPYTYATGNPLTNADPAGMLGRSCIGGLGRSPRASTETKESKNRVSWPATGPSRGRSWPAALPGTHRKYPKIGGNTSDPGDAEEAYWLDRRWTSDWRPGIARRINLGWGYYSSVKGLIATAGALFGEGLTGSGSTLVAIQGIYNTKAGLDKMARGGRQLVFATSAPRIEPCTTRENLSPLAWGTIPFVPAITEGPLEWSAPG